ncbi:LIC_13246 family protein [Leptospira kmetyi]|uniref:Uncharacterized protein n=1 Tax=Leptospira kmetyi TaxID=408139 RepID=A0ABX4N934_9LEPT|nr:hypothetical protein [Leptospira kmetyi]PJZ29846.1 hypothetical protein CH378_10390 [Leptospira kmetyi]PJZ42320.1 hypothetical protein CH370_06700 [Leptospira kmetyi]TGK15990.1 hypothetical protein EHO62_09495 [Leptospira kmetyi]TGK32020.1 hypothetical protein EHO66_06475 [Leptospira kmetyi]
MKDTIDLNQGEWMKLVSKKEEFRRIVSTLNRFYIPRIPFSKLNEGQRMRFRLAENPVKDFEVFFKKNRECEFLVFLKVDGRFESWIHLDGIQEERDRFLKEGKTDHDIFQIICLSDLYENHCVFAEEEETKTLKVKDSA